MFKLAVTFILISVFQYRSKQTVLNDSLPFRLTNLVPNAKIELVSAPKKKTNGIVNIKISFPEYTGVAKLSSQTTIWNILRYFEGESGINITKRSVDKGSVTVYEMPQVQLFNTIITKLEDLDQPLEAVGISSGSALMRIRFEAGSIPFETAADTQQRFKQNDNEPVKNEEALKTTRAPEPESDEKQPTAEPTGQTQTAETVSNEKAPSGSGSVSGTSVEDNKKRRIQVYLPTQNTRTIPDDASVEDMTSSQFRLYRAQLNSMSGSDKKDAPLTTAAMREQQRNANKRQITECVIRVRLPDQTHVEGKFHASETIADVYDFVKSTLRNPDIPFLLFMYPPRTVLGDPTQRLVDDCNLGARVLVYLEWDTEQVDSSTLPKEKLLNDSALASAKPITEDESIKIDESQPKNNDEGDSLKSKDGGDSNKTAGSTPKVSGSSSNSTGKPKWFRLGRK